ncbi:MAG: hypothetical protein ACI9CF_001035 [Candidatus Omnitrophota bacterium]|jgi:hypothetical protein
MPTRNSHDMLVNVKSKLSRAEIDQQELELEASAKFLFKDLDNAERVKLGLKRQSEQVLQTSSNDVITLSIEVAAMIMAISAFTWVFSSGNVTLSLIAGGASLAAGTLAWFYLKKN